MKNLIVILFVSLFATAIVAQEKFTVPTPTDTQKMNNWIGQWNAIFLNQINYAKSLGKTAEDVANFTGDQFKTSWNKEVGFDGFVKATLFNWVCMVSNGKVEILEQSDAKIIFKATDINPWLKANGPKYNVSYEEYIKCIEIVHGKIAEYLGAKCTYNNTVEGIVVTIEKK